MKNTTWAAWLLAAASVSASFPAWAQKVISVSPQGEVAQVRQVVVKFDAPVVSFGDPKAANPFTLSCSDAQASKGNARWISGREWAFELERDLPPGVRCTLNAVSSFKSTSGAAVSSSSSYAFNSGGPFVRSARPGSGTIDEEQIFVYLLNGAANPATLAGNLWCAIEGVGERVDVKLIDGSTRAQVLEAVGLEREAKEDPQRVLTFSCNRRLNSSGRVSVVFGKGIATPSGIANNVEKRFNYKVREPFAASFSCERENAQAPCSPISPMQLKFNAPVTVKLAKSITLKGGGKTHKPELDKRRQRR
jgi:alpha-2-macroglobulin